MGFGELAAEWENCSVIRSRFRRDESWLQWPYVQHLEADGEEAIEKHPVCTKSLEMNSAALMVMIDHYHGAFVDINALHAEATSSICNC